MAEIAEIFVPGRNSNFSIDILHLFSGGWILGTLTVLLMGMGMGGMYLTFKHFMKSPVCNSKARCDKPQNSSELKEIISKKKSTHWFLKLS